ncbi:hypothetical protein L249_6270, partial [Ophiocordyceps polyrhachis-furcata BCC 54312]
MTLAARGVGKKNEAGIKKGGGGGGVGHPGPCADTTRRLVQRRDAASNAYRYTLYTYRPYLV